MAVQLFPSGSFSLETRNSQNPEEIVKELIPQIEEATSGLVTCHLREYYDLIFLYSDRESSPSIRSVFDTPRDHQETRSRIQEELGELNREDKTYEVYLKAKDIPDYKYRILFFSFGTGGYPVTIVVNEDLAKEINKGLSNYVFRCNTMEEFEALITSILRTNHLRAIIQGIIDSSIRGDYYNTKEVKIFYSELDEQALTDILLCDPITIKGRRALARLGLDSVITPDYFYRRLYAQLSFEKEYVRETPFNKESEKETIQKFEEYSRVRKAFHEFERRMQSDIPNQSPLVLIGAAGIGKTIEVNRLIYSADNDFEFGAVRKSVTVTFDDEFFNDRLTFRIMYTNPYPQSIQWGVCFKLLKTVMTYIEGSKQLCRGMALNYFEQIKDTQRFTEEYTELMETIFDYGDGSRDKIGNVFQKMIEFMGGVHPPQEYAPKAAKQLMAILMLLMYCTNPNAKNYIIFDNIDAYMRLNTYNVQVWDTDVEIIISVINMAVLKMIEVFNEIGKVINVDNLGWKRFKVIVVMRREFLRLFDGAFGHMRSLQSPYKRDNNIVDYTSCFKLSDIWFHKKDLWENFLKKGFNKSDPDSEKKILITDLLMDEGKRTKASYQRLMSQIVNHNLRGNAIAQSHAIIDIYKTLRVEDNSMVTYEEFRRLTSESSIELGSLTRYMLKCALIESHFKWEISDKESRNRWCRLGIGHLEYHPSIIDDEHVLIKRDFKYDIGYVPVQYIDVMNVSLMRRVMAYLSRTPDNKNDTGIGLGVDIFFPVSLYDLIEGVLALPNELNEEVNYQYFVPLARVLLSLANVSFDETKGTQFAMLKIKDNGISYECSPEEFATLLARIYYDGKNAPGSNGDNKDDYSIMLTDAGYAFLSRWQTSFSFIASLYCYTVPSLFFLKDTKTIEYVIFKVFVSSCKLCTRYEEEARIYCKCKDLDEIHFYQGGYLYEKNGKNISFRDQIVQQHQEHLRLYKDYIIKNYQKIGFDSVQVDEIVTLVDVYLQKYQRLKKRESSVCF